MHGQKRSEYKSRLLNPETSSKLATKAQQWNHLSYELLQQRKKLFSGESSPSNDNGGAVADDGGGSEKKPSPQILLSLTEKMLSVNPDPSHLWNIRREMLLYVQPIVEKQQPVNSPTINIEAELALTTHCLQRNPKSYSSWYHRKWSLVYYLTHPPTICTTNEHKQKHLDSMKSMLQSELELCAQFLQMDERNFHCWNYRRFVVAILGSCGGKGSSSNVEESSISDIAVKTDVDMIFNGSWSSWLDNQSQQVSMGAQLSEGSMAAVGNIPSSDNTKQGSDIIIAKFVSPLSKQELEEIVTNEWDFTTSKIQDNFSNGSAFHYRSKLLPLILESRLSSGDSPSPSDRYKIILSLARDEWESIILNAVFTEPDDQTPWWYHRFIVSWAKPSDELVDADDELIQEYDELLFEMADSLRELLEVEKEGDDMGSSENKDESKGAKCKWAYIGLHLVLSTLLKSKSLDDDDDEAAELKEEAAECLTELIKIDPNRIERYQNLAIEINRM